MLDNGNLEQCLKCYFSEMIHSTEHSSPDENTVLFKRTNAHRQYNHEYANTPWNMILQFV